MEKRTAGQMSKGGEKGKDGAGWMRKEAKLGPARLLHRPVFPHWMTSTQTARHHDGHSPPLMSPSHS